MTEISKRFFTWKTALGFIAAFILLFILMRQVEPVKIYDVFKTINWFYFIIALVLALIPFPIIAYRWGLLLENVGYKIKLKDLTEIVLLFYFANMILPFKLGEFYRGYLMKKNYDIPISKTMGTIVIERLIDMFFLGILMIVTALLVFKKILPSVLGSLIILCLMIITILSIIVIIIYKPGIIPSKFKKIVFLFREGISSIKLKNIFQLFSFSLLRWLMTIVSVYYIILALNISLSIPQMSFIIIASNLVQIIPFTPGGLGITDLTVFGTLKLFGIGAVIAASATYLFRILGYWFILIVTGIVFIRSDKR